MPGQQRHQQAVHRHRCALRVHRLDRHLRVQIALALICAACSAPPISLRIAEYDPIARTLAPVAEGGDLHLQIPPQGGIVLFIGALATNVSGVVELRARLSVDGTLVGEDRRASTFVRGAPPLDSIAAMANVPVCPAGGLVSLDRAATLEVALVEVESSRSARVTQSVTPRCTQSDANLLALCRCDCAADFAPGHC